MVGPEAQIACHEALGKLRVYRAIGQDREVSGVILKMVRIKVNRIRKLATPCTLLLFKFMLAVVGVMTPRHHRTEQLQQLHPGSGQWLPVSHCDPSCAFSSIRRSCDK